VPRLLNWASDPFFSSLFFDLANEATLAGLRTRRLDTSRLKSQSPERFANIVEENATELTDSAEERLPPGALESATTSADF